MITFVNNIQESFTFESVEEIEMDRFSPRGLDQIEYAGVIVYMESDEHAIAHRMRKRLRMGETTPEYCYILLTTHRRIMFFQDGHVVSIPPVQVEHVIFTDLKLMPSELEYARQFPMPDCSVGKWLTQEIQKYFLGKPGEVETKNF